MNYKTKLSGIKLFAFDYDGVFTNGTVYLMPDGSMAAPPLPGTDSPCNGP